ncbi:MAG: hypothetical protein V3V61_07395 [Gammaproteobacteria bacterium]
MAIYKGFEGIIKNGNDIIAEVRNWTLELSADTTDASIIGDEWQHYVATLKSWTCSLSAWWDESDTNGQASLTIGKKFMLQLYPGGELAKRGYFSGDAYVTGLSISGAHDSIVEADFTFQGTGELRLLKAVMKTDKADKSTTIKATKPESL